MFRLTASAVCFQLGLGYGEATLEKVADRISTSWSHPINTKNEPLPLIWLDEAALEAKWDSVDLQGDSNIKILLNFCKYHNTISVMQYY